MKAKVFISCGQRKDTEETIVAEQIAECLKAKGFEPYVAVQQQSLRGLKENIFEELASSEYFLFIDFKREQIAEDAHRGSLFCHQELAIASFLDIPMVGFQEAGVKPDDGILQFLQANCTPFSDRQTLCNMVADRIEEIGWRPDWKNQIALERNSEQFEDAFRLPERKNARFFHINVRNLNPYKHARNCYAFIESVQNLSSGEFLPVRTVELKWAGYTLPNATILPLSSRSIDGFFVFHESPNTPHFNLYSDSGHFYIRIKGPGDYELTYLVVSDNFEPVSSRVRMHLTGTVDEIRFE